MTSQHQCGPKRQELSKRFEFGCVDQSLLDQMLEHKGGNFGRLLTCGTINLWMSRVEDDPFFIKFHIFGIDKWMCNVIIYDNLLSAFEF
jgi:hypothetical protein